MIYVMSDLHGCYDKYKRMLKEIRFGDSDTLYVLGDVVDRGPKGLKILLDMSRRKNVVFLWGNHDFLAMQILNKMYDQMGFVSDEMELCLQMWVFDGGNTTWDEFERISPQNRRKVLEYLLTGRSHVQIEVNGRKFFLAHTVPVKMKMLNLQDCKIDDFLEGTPEYEQTYYEDEYIVTGHTPTGLIAEEYSGRIYVKNNHIAIDCGAVFENGRLGCIRLNDMKEYYV